MALKLIATYGNGDRVAKVMLDKEWEEYRVRHYVDGKLVSQGDYHTASNRREDLADAMQTAKLFCRIHN